MESYSAPHLLSGKTVTTREALAELSARLDLLQKSQAEMEYKVESLSDNVLASRLKDDSASKDSGDRDDELEGLNIKCNSLDSKIASLLDLVKLALAKSELTEKVVNGRSR
jgi:chromosome segregation ATPase